MTRSSQLSKVYKRQQQLSEVVTCSCIDIIRLKVLRLDGAFINVFKSYQKVWKVSKGYLKLQHAIVYASSHSKLCEPMNRRSNVFKSFQNKTYVFITISICSNATPQFSLRFQYIPTKHFCLPYVFNNFPRNTCVFHMFSIRSYVKYIFI